jgi:hypothetical protein
MSPSVAPVRRSGSIARRNARSRAAVTTSSVSPPIFIELARHYGRYGYRKVAALLRQAGGQSTTSGSSASGDARG